MAAGLRATWYSERFAAYVRTGIRPAYFAPVLPVGINPADPDDLEIMWSYAPEPSGNGGATSGSARSPLR